MAVRSEELADRVRSALLNAAVEAYEDAGLRGLCAEGRWECALGAMRSLDLVAVRNAWESSTSSGPSRPGPGRNGGGEE